jgi:hypothetical protein
VQNIDLTQEYRRSYGVKRGLFSFGGDVQQRKSCFKIYHHHPKTGQFIVVDDVTGDILQVGGPGFRFED